MNKSPWFNVLAVVIVVAILIATGPTPVSAQDEPIEGFCEFGFFIEVLDWNRTTIEIEDASKIFSLEVGKFKARIINAETEDFVDLNVPGPARFIPNSDGTTTTAIFTGPWLQGIPPDVLPDFTPRLFLMTGRAVAQVDNETGDYLSLTVAGHVTDLCAALAE